MNWTNQQLFNELVQLEEQQRIEAKRASSVGYSIMQTVCAFANEPGLGGGWLLLGVAEPDVKHNSFWICGAENTDQLLNELQNNCRQQFEQPVHIECKHSKIEGKSVIGVFVHELDVSAKPCRFTGNFDKHNKRKTGVWRRGVNGDYECTEKELEPILIAKSGITYEQIVLPECSLEDLDDNIIELYRRLRAKVRPSAEELQADNINLLRALRVLKYQNGEYVPNIAGLLLFGKALSLRRLLPAVRVDYVRVSGSEWVEDPHQRFEYSLDLRESLITLIPKIENVILDEIPRHFRLEEGELQRSDQPFLPQKVIREAIVNAVMHRDYSVHQPTIIVRYSNRLEMCNAGYSLKPLEDLNHMNSVLRNPILANVLYDLEFAETKGSGFRTMKRLLGEIGLTHPILVSNRESNNFTAKFLLHHLMSEEQLVWLQQFKSLNLSDNETKALILAKEIGAIDNAALRAITELDTLAASKLLRRLWQQYHLLERGGSGRNTYYKLAFSLVADHKSENDANGSRLDANGSRLDANGSRLDANGSRLDTNGSRLDTNGSRLDNEGELSDVLQEAIYRLSPKARASVIRSIILNLCFMKGYSAEEMGALLKRDVTNLKTRHLTPMREEGLIAYLYPEVVSHPNQAYVITKKGKQVLENKAQKLA